MLNFSVKNQTKYYESNSETSSYLAKDLKNILKQKNFQNYVPIILCIGTDRATGDCLGPLVGSRLYKYNDNFLIMGTLDSPIHALNISDTIKYINSAINNPLIIAIDASLGSNSHVGYITLSEGPIAPGKGVNKKLPVIGDVSITGIVNVISNSSTGLLQSTRLNLVMKLANIITEALIETIDYFDDFPL